MHMKFALVVACLNLCACRGSSDAPTGACLQFASPQTCPAWCYAAHVANLDGSSFICADDVPPASKGIFPSSCAAAGGFCKFGLVGCSKPAPSAAACEELVPAGVRCCFE